MRVLDKDLDLYLVEGVSDLNEVERFVSAQDVISFDIEVLPPPRNMNAFVDRDSDVVGFSFSNGVRSYFCFVNDESLGFLRWLCEEEKPVKVLHNWIFDSSFLFLRKGIRLWRFEDTYLMARMVYMDGVSLGLKDLCKDVLHLDSERFKVDFKKVGRSNDLAVYGAYDAWLTYRLYEHLKPILERKGWVDLYMRLREVEVVLLEIFLSGIKVDLQDLARLRVELSENIGDMRRAIYVRVGKEFNLNSTRELANILFKELGLKPVKFTRRLGVPAVDEEVLRELSAESEVARMVLEYRRLEKLRSTFVDRLEEWLVDGRIHAVFNFDTKSLRVASRSPNMQNIPRDSVIRRVFRAEDGMRFIMCDFNQAELRMIAEVSGDRNLMNIFREGQDLHSIVAKEIFGLDCSVEEVKEKYSEFRSKAKGVNFGIAYGVSAKGLSGLLGITKEEADRIIQRWYSLFRGVRSLNDRVRQRLIEEGCIKNFFGLERHVENFEDLLRLDPVGAQALLREVFNWIIQSSTAILAHLGLLNAYEWLKENRFLDYCYPVLHLHDGFIFECEERYVERVASNLAGLMSSAVRTVVPFTVEVSVGERWAS
jgi:DNA polymerase-1